MRLPLINPNHTSVPHLVQSAVFPNRQEDFPGAIPPNGVAGYFVQHKQRLNSLKRMVILIWTA